MRENHGGIRIGRVALPAALLASSLTSSVVAQGPGSDPSSLSVEDEYAYDFDDDPIDGNLQPPDPPPVGEGEDGLVPSGEPTTEEIDPDTDLASLLQDRVVATASRASESADAAPAATYTIGRTELEQYGIRSLEEAFAFLGLGMFVSNPGWDYVSTLDVGVHGVLVRDDNRHILLLVDGHVMNSQAAGLVHLDATLGVPMNSIDHVEVMLGPGSVGYGSNAMLAVVNVVTRHGPAVGGFEVYGDANLLLPTDAGHGLARLGSGRAPGVRSRTGIGYGGRFGGDARPIDFSVHVELQQDRSATFDVAPQTGDYIEIRPGETAWGETPGRYSLLAPSGIANLAVGGFSLTAQGGFFRRDAPYSGTWDEPTAQDQEVAARLDATYDADPGRRVHVRTRLYGDMLRMRSTNSWTHDWWCLPGQTQGCSIEARIQSYSGGVEHTSSVDWGLDQRYPTLFGVDLRLRRATGRPADYFDSVTGVLGDGVTRRPRIAETSMLGAVFVQQVLRPTERLTINLGARLDYDSLFGARVSPRLSLVVNPRRTSTFRFAYGEAFRGPTAVELQYTDLVYALPPDALDAEVARFADVEWIERFDRARLSARAFTGIYTDLVDDIQVDPVDAQAAIDAGILATSADPNLIVTASNLGTLYTFGGTFALRVEPTSRLELATGLSGAATLVDTPGFGGSLVEPVMPYFFGNARAAYRFDAGNTTVAVATQFSSDRTAMTLPGNGADVSLSAGAIFDLRLTVSGDLGDDTGLTYRAGLTWSANSQSTNLLAPGPGTPADQMDPEFLGSESAVFAPLPRFAAYVGLRYRRPTPP